MFWFTLISCMDKVWFKVFLILPRETRVTGSLLEKFLFYFYFVHSSSIANVILRLFVKCLNSLCVFCHSESKTQISLFSAVFQHYLANQQLVLCTSASTSRACTILANSWKLKKLFLSSFWARYACPVFSHPQRYIPARYNFLCLFSDLLADTTKTPCTPLGPFVIHFVWYITLSHVLSFPHSLSVLFHSLYPLILLCSVSLSFVPSQMFLLSSLSGFMDSIFRFLNFQPLFSGLKVTSYFEGKNARCFFFS